MRHRDGARARPAGAAAQPRLAAPPLRVVTFGGAACDKSALVARLLEKHADAPRAAGRKASPLPFAPPAGAVAYHRLATGRRRIVVADTRDDAQDSWTLAAAAFAADLALVLVGADEGVTAETRRHTHVAALFGVRHVVLAVDKLDQIAFDQARFEAIVAAYEDIARPLGFRSLAAVPVSALHGDNVCEPSADMPWYRGPTVLARLDAADTRPNPQDQPFRMRLEAADGETPGVGGYRGTIVAGSIGRGDAVATYPGGRTARVDRILAGGNDRGTAVAGSQVTLTLSEALEVDSGGLLAAPDAPPTQSDQLAAHVFWLSKDHLLAGRRYEMAFGSATATATVTELKHRLNLDTFDHQAAKTLERGEIGFCNFGLDRVVAFDPYVQSPETGTFILRDRADGRTVGAGMVAFGLRRASNLSWQALDVDRAARAALMGHRPCVLWFTGLSGSGKSSVANRVEQRLHAEGRHTYILDGDNVRHGLSRDLGFTEADRVENIRRIAEVSRLMVDAGLIVLVAFISPFESDRRMARELFRPGEFVEVFMDTPLEVCETRDLKGLYRKARAGELVNFTGIDSPYEPPSAPELCIRPEDGAPDDQAQIVIDYLKRTGTA